MITYGSPIILNPNSPPFRPKPTPITDRAIGLRPTQSPTDTIIFSPAPVIPLTSQAPFPSNADHILPYPDPMNPVEIHGLEDISSQYLRGIYRLHETDLEHPNPDLEQINNNTPSESEFVETEPEEESIEFDENANLNTLAALGAAIEAMADLGRISTSESATQYEPEPGEITPEEGEINFADVHETTLQINTTEQAYYGPEPYISGDYTTPNLLELNLQELEQHFGQNQVELEAHLDLINLPPPPLNALIPDNNSPLPLPPDHSLPPNPPAEPELEHHLGLEAPEQGNSEQSTDQQTLRRSARISGKGFTKNYSPKKTRKRKQKQPEGPSDSEVLQAAILMSLQAELLAYYPLTQEQADEVDRICGMESSEPLLTVEAWPSSERIGIKDYRESILAELEFDSSEDRLTDDEPGSDEDRP